jgi:hypothetical protein
MPRDSCFQEFEFFIKIRKYEMRRPIYTNAAVILKKSGTVKRVYQNLQKCAQSFVYRKVFLATKVDAFKMNHLNPKDIPFLDSPHSASKSTMGKFFNFFPCKNCFVHHFFLFYCWK